MTGWTQINGTAVALPQENVDTDQLIPARFMSAPRADGYGKFLSLIHISEPTRPY